MLALLVVVICRHFFSESCTIVLLNLGIRLSNLFLLSSVHYFASAGYVFPIHNFTFNHYMLRGDKIFIKIKWTILKYKIIDHFK